MKNWKTTVGGIVAAVGLTLQASDDPKVKMVGYVLAGIGTLFFGINAKDNNVTGGTKQQ